MSISKSIACHVRLRPTCPNDGFVNPDAIKISGNSISAMNKENDKRYHFDLDKCHDAPSTQEEVFECVKPMIEQAIAGQNTTIFTYGVTGSGKTHTMQGNQSDPGIIPRTIESIFRKQSETPNPFSVSFSHVEILKDEVYDLLGDRSEPKKRDIRTSAEGQNVVADLIIQPINSVTEFDIIYDAAAKTRKTASTKLNSSSSRSHAILTIYLQHPGSDAGHTTQHGKICASLLITSYNLTDLAGSENNNLTGNDKERMRESSAINTSLTTLGKVIDALNEKAKRGHKGSGTAFIPYRDSKLTRLLQDALGGSSQGLLICCLAPGEKFARDTINTLQSVTSTSANPAFKVHTGSGPRHSAPTCRVALSSIFTNTPSMRGGNTILQDVKENTTAGKCTTDKDRSDLNKGMTDQQLDRRIQKIVSEQMAIQAEKTKPELVSVGTETECIDAKPVVVVDPIPQNVGHDTMSKMSEAEKDERARVIVSHARKLHHSGNLHGALELYKKAFEYAPANRKLSMRITEIKLSIEGMIPTSNVTSSSNSKPKMEDQVPKSGMKRSHGHLDSLAEISYEESPAKKGRS
uniref:Kinesin motor domain-containing protein n=1 Tax=Kwoniella dejecticola CBS 10117 TaxID=1296121 RepID=A0A1A6A7L9_9TREE|nr:uncharacterized protein I303_03770 [Kwoniella dejecticola CBS 10117]OBR86052.1 hypothetical protein I303_03770 [Kwoniella dejecticola CBS 10117]